MALSLPRPSRSSEYIAIVRDGLRQLDEQAGRTGRIKLPALVRDLERQIAEEYRLTARVVIVPAEARKWSCRVDLLNPDDTRAGGGTFTIQFHS